MKSFKFTVYLSCFLLSFTNQIFYSLYAQTNLSGIVNTYAPVQSISTDQTSINIGTPQGTGSFVVGNKVLIIQMKGANITTTNDENYGKITQLNEAGNYEFAYIAAISGNQIIFTNALEKAFNPTGLVQIVRVVTLAEAVVTVDGLTGLPWNGTVGGVLALEVQNTLTLNGDISMSGRGFRGGNRSSSGGDCSVQTYRSNSNRLGFKGEGIAIEPGNQVNARGALANGGGGGNGHNAGGGGGSLVGRGGRGGREWAGNPISGWCGVQDASCDDLYAVGGVGGHPLGEFFGTRYFMGGGGGGGQQDNGTGTAGGNGGGIIYLKANTIVNNGFFINSNGNSANNAGFDGGGGGGAGGTVLIDCTNFIGSTNISVKGGNGGNTGGCHGPGGAGGGGLIQFLRITTNFNNLTFEMSSGTNGTQTSSNCGGSTVDSNYCAEFYTEPSEGMIVQNTPLPIRLVYFRGEVNQQQAHHLYWQTSFEQNNAFFTIERSTDAQSYTPVAQIDGKGNSEILNSYAWEDTAPQAGWNYYRLKQTDTDGTFTYSTTIVALENKQSETFTPKVYPNPTTSEGKITISIEGLENPREVSWGLLDGQGRVLSEYIQAQTFTWEIDLKKYPKGIYFVRLLTSHKVETLKVIKQN